MLPFGVDIHRHSLKGHPGGKTPPGCLLGRSLLPCRVPLNSFSQIPCIFSCPLGNSPCANVRNVSQFHMQN